MMRPHAPKQDNHDTKRHIACRQRASVSAAGRIDWVDYAKGICIVMVVMMHSVLGVEAAAGQTGFMHGLVMFAKPFRMPDFFLISGLFLAVVIDRDWRTYLDRKVVHFAYFYVLWVTIQFGFKAPSFAAESGWAPCRLSVSGILHRAVRHAVVHLSAADLLCRHKTDTQRAAAGDLCRGGAAGNGACLDRLDRDRRILRALRLFLCGLLAGFLCLRPVGSRAGAARTGARGSGTVGARQWRRWSIRATANGRWSRSHWDLPAPAPSS